MRSLWKIALLSSFFAMSYACGSSNKDSNSIAAGSNDSNNTKSAGGGATGTSQDSQAAQQGAQSADQASSSDGLGAGRSGATQMALQVANRLLDLNSVGDFSATIKVGSCTSQADANATISGDTVTIAATNVFSDGNCTGAIKLAGTQNITVDASLTTGDRTTTVVGDLNMTIGNGDVVAISSLSGDVPYTYQLTATGTPSLGDVNVTVALNEHRVRSTNGNVDFDHNITTPASAAVEVVVAYSGTTPQSHTVVGGEVDVHHNLAKFAAKHTYNNLKHDITGNCACPQSGSITQVVTADSNAWTYTRTYVFTGCGGATVTTSGSTLAGTDNGTATVIWDNCTP